MTIVIVFMLALAAIFAIIEIARKNGADLDAWAILLVAGALLLTRL